MIRQIWRHRQRFFWQPPCTEAAAQCFLFDHTPRVLRPSAYRFRLSSIRDPYRLAPIFPLFQKLDKATVLRRIVAVDIDAVNRHPWCIAMSHSPLSEGLKGTIPGITDTNTTPTILGIVLVTGASTPPTEGTPHTIQRRFRGAMSLVQQLTCFPAQAPTRLCGATAKMIEGNQALCPTHTANKTDTASLTLSTTSTRFPLEEIASENCTAAKNLAWKDCESSRRHTKPLSSARSLCQVERGSTALTCCVRVAIP